MNGLLRLILGERLSHSCAETGSEIFRPYDFCIRSKRKEIVKYLLLGTIKYVDIIMGKRIYLLRTGIKSGLIGLLSFLR